MLLFRSAGTNPDLSYHDIAFLTFEAVLEVVIICVAGFVAARSGILNTRGQKVISQLNVDIFTPCLVFTKLAPSLSLQRLADIAVIPIFYAVSTGISFTCAKLVSGPLFNLNEPEADFVTAMAVFGNSNSLPVSLTLSLASTLPDLLWEDIDDDTPEKVASRGILYLLIFQQLGQILRWSWGYNKLLRKRSLAELNTYTNANGDLEHFVPEESGPLLTEPRPSYTSTGSSAATFIGDLPPSSEDGDSDQDSSSINKGPAHRTIVKLLRRQSPLNRTWKAFKDLPVVREFLAFMNPPLYSMLVSVIVASVPSLQNLFFGEDNFVKSTVTKSVSQLGSVSVPLILIVLGSNLYPSSEIPAPSRNYTKVVTGSLLARMILPSFFMLPIIALCVKYIKLSILDDPILLIVAFILTMSPPAIQLSQIIQINNIYQKEMAGVLFWGYVVLTLPTTIFIVVAALEVLKWAV